jgi:hypothetical protein
MLKNGVLAVVGGEPDPSIPCYVIGCRPGRAVAEKRSADGALTNLPPFKKRPLCCCCGLVPASEPNGLCRDCAENCAGYILKDKPCSTIERRKSR